MKQFSRNHHPKKLHSAAGRDNPKPSGPKLPCCRSPTPCLPVPGSLGVQRHRHRSHWSCTQPATYQHILIQKYINGYQSTHFDTEITLEKSPFIYSAIVLQLLCSFGKQGREEDVMLNRPHCSLALSASC